jgi:SNF2 family DNA or RNA helicase
VWTQHRTLSQGDAHQRRSPAASSSEAPFDPYFGLSISRVDPLPHQLEAVYDYLLKLPSIRFLLADDAGAGKTIMAGLLIRELKLRGLAERVLIICPANLTFQWQRELKEKFEEKFIVLKGDLIREQFGINQWLETPMVITSLDLAKRENILPGLKQVRWDLVVVDEAHRMSWTPPSKKTARYALGELLRDSSDNLLMLTATPHKGDPTNFSLFLQLLDEDAYADVKSIRFPKPSPIRWFERVSAATSFYAAFRPLFRLDLASPPGIGSETLTLRQGC